MHGVTLIMKCCSYFAVVYLQLKQHTAAVLKESNINVIMNMEYSDGTLNLVTHIAKMHNL